MLLIQLLLKRTWISRSFILGPLVLLLFVCIVEFFVGVHIVVHPGLNLVRGLLVKVATGGQGVDEHVFGVEANMVRGQGLVTPKNHLTPQVRVLSRLVHGPVRLEVVLDVQLVLLKHGSNLQLAGLWVIKDLIEVSPDSVLLLVEQVKVASLDAVHMLS